MKKSKKLIISIVLGILAVFVVGSIVYVNDYYHSDSGMKQYLKDSDTVSVKNIEDGLFFDGPGGKQAMIFYPGAKVEYTAYAPIMKMLAEEGGDCFLIRMPGNLAVFGVDKAESIQKDYEYDSWYMSGHSLGGAMAASYSAEHLDELDGLILLAAYPTKSLKKDEFEVISIYGSEDEILNRENLENGKKYMPENYMEVCIEGGNHAGFVCSGKIYRESKETELFSWNQDTYSLVVTCRDR